jgi:hypothetical protein
MQVGLKLFASQFGCSSEASRVFACTIGETKSPGFPRLLVQVTGAVSSTLGNNVQRNRSLLMLLVNVARTLR